MEVKPLTKERRAEIETHVIHKSHNYIFVADLEQMAKEILAAEAFWREALKTAPHYGYGGFCSFCKDGRGDGTPDTPDCPWLLANQE